MAYNQPAPSNIKILVWSVAALFQVMSGNLQADSPDDEELAGWNSVTMRLGGYKLEADVAFAVQNDGGSKDLVNLNRLGVDENDTSHWISAMWRFGRKWSLHLGAFRYDEDGFGEWESDFDFGDITFPAGAASYTRLATDFYSWMLFIQLFAPHSTNCPWGLEFTPSISRLNSKPGSTRPKSAANVLISWRLCQTRL